MSVDLSIVAHTNAGKTTLVRTLLKRDIGEVADRPHVTEDAERHMLVDTPRGDVLYLWDTPGFGDSARLLRRLRASGNPIGWLQTQVWDRLVDRPFFCSQRAVRNVRDESDLVLYLVNAAEDPSAAAYVEAELEILEWVGKPVLLVLNQSGPPRPREVEASEEARWNRQLAQHIGSHGVITLDAFARCWVQEDRLLGAVAALLEPARQAELDRLRAAWRDRNLEVFRSSMRSIAAHIGATAADREHVPERLDGAALAQRVKHWIARARDEPGGPQPAVEAAMSGLSRRLETRLREDLDRMIALHGLAGQSRRQILARTAGQFEVAMPADVAGTSLLGGLVTGAAGGLAADLSTGGITLGAGMLVGAILGALGAGGAARAYNLMQGQEDGLVRWSASWLDAEVQASLLRYLAVAHFGRGRGDWVQGEAAPHWPPLVAAAVQARADALHDAWMLATEGADAGRVAARLEPVLEATARDVLLQLYPEAGGIFAAQAGPG